MTINSHSNQNPINSHDRMKIENFVNAENVEPKSSQQQNVKQVAEKNFEKQSNESSLENNPKLIRLNKSQLKNLIRLISSKDNTLSQADIVNIMNYSFPKRQFSYEEYGVFINEVKESLNNSK